MQRLADFIANSPVYAGIAEKNFPQGSVIRCRRCGIKRSCTTSEIAKWLKVGLPRCKKCGHKTELDNPWVNK